MVIRVVVPKIVLDDTDRVRDTNNQVTMDCLVLNKILLNLCILFVPSSHRIFIHGIYGIGTIPIPISVGIISLISVSLSV